MPTPSTEPPRPAESAPERATEAAEPRDARTVRAPERRRAAVELTFAGPERETPAERGGRPVVARGVIAGPIDRIRVAGWGPRERALGFDGTARLAIEAPELADAPMLTASILFRPRGWALHAADRGRMTLVSTDRPGLRLALCRRGDGARRIVAAACVRRRVGENHGAVALGWVEAAADIELGPRWTSATAIVTGRALALCVDGRVVARRPLHDGAPVGAVGDGALRITLGEGFVGEIAGFALRPALCVADRALLAGAARAGHGAVAARHADLAGAEGVLGAPIGPEIPWRDGYFRQYEHGRVAWSPAHGAWSVRGPIDALYADWMDRLGPPVADEQPTRGGARVGLFEDGAIWWSPRTGAGAVPGPAALLYDDLGGPRGALGLPTETDPDAPLEDGLSFERGRMFVDPEGAAFALHGAVLGRYLDAGGPRGRLGWPRSDVVPVRRGRDPEAGRFARFERGGITWSPGGGARLVDGPILAAWLAAGGADGPLGFPVADTHPLPDAPEAPSPSAPVGPPLAGRFQGGEIIARPGQPPRIEGAAPAPADDWWRLGAGGTPTLPRFRIERACRDATAPSAWQPAARPLGGQFGAPIDDPAFARLAAAGRGFAECAEALRARAGLSGFARPLARWTALDACEALDARQIWQIGAEVVGAWVDRVARGGLAPDALYRRVRRAVARDGGCVLVGFDPRTGHARAALAHACHDRPPSGDPALIGVIAAHASAVDGPNGSDDSDGSSHDDSCHLIHPTVEVRRDGLSLRGWPGLPAEARLLDLPLAALVRAPRSPAKAILLGDRGPLGALLIVSAGAGLASATVGDGDAFIGGAPRLDPATPWVRAPLVGAVAPPWLLARAAPPSGPIALGLHPRRAWRVRAVLPGAALWVEAPGAPDERARVVLIPGTGPPTLRVECEGPVRPVTLGCAVTRDPAGGPPRRFEVELPVGAGTPGVAGFDPETGALAISAAAGRVRITVTECPPGGDLRWSPPTLRARTGERLRIHPRPDLDRAPRRPPRRAVVERAPAPEGD